METYSSHIDGGRLTTFPEGNVEDRVNTLLTKDPNKLKIYLGHTVYELTVNGTKQLIRDDAVVPTRERYSPYTNLNPHT